jgi:hypothetical protein
MIYYRVFNKNFSEIQKITGVRLISDAIKTELDSGISSVVKRIVFEYPYIDKDFRDTFYNDFSKRHVEFDRQCVRLHFFTNEFDDISELNESTYEIFNKSYMGFIVLRDTLVATLGRSYLDPKILEFRSKGFASLSKTQVNLYGYEFTINAFPWMRQDGNVSRCAHIALWSVIRYYSDRYSIYAEKTLYQITRLLQSERRTNPSIGMSLAQISQVLKDCNFFPEIYLIDTCANPAYFFRILYSVVESGLPSIAALQGPLGDGHAVALFGHGKLNNADNYCKRYKDGIVDCCELVPYLIASDDNQLPYTMIAHDPSAVSGTHGNIYSCSNIFGLIVPYHEKMLLDITSIFGGKIYDGCLSFIEKNFLTFPPNTPIVRRTFLTTSKSYKQFLTKQPQAKTFKDKILLLDMPRFIWLVEYSLPSQFDSKQVQWLILLDASAMNYFDKCYLAIKNGDKLILNPSDMSSSKLHSFPLENPLEIQYTHNLGAIV